MITPLLNAIRSLLKYCLPILLAAAPLLALYGAIAKPVPAAISETFPDKYAVLVGLTKSCADSCTSSSSYALFPSAMVVSAVTGPDGTTKVHRDPTGLVGLLLSYGLCALGTWWLWRGKRTPPNNSFKPKPLRGSA